MSATPKMNDEWADVEKSMHLQNILTLEEMVNEEHLEKIKLSFENRKSKMMSKRQFKEVLEDILQVTFVEEEFNILFMKMDEKRNGVVDWDEFVSRLHVELQEKDRVISKEIWQTPLNGPPIFLSSNHRHPIKRILFYPALKQDKSVSAMDGKYVTLSKDGTVNFWSAGFELEKTYSSQTYGQRVHPTWVTDMVCLPDVMMIATSSTERDIRFYDTMARHFELRMVITSLEKAITSMAYHMGSNEEGISHIVTGDMGGYIRIFSFGRGLTIDGTQDCKTGARGPFSFRPGEDVKVFLYEGIKKGQLPQLLITEFFDIHPSGEWVKQVAYFHSLKSFVSCVNSSENSLVIQDVRASTKVAYNFHIPRGVSCFAVYEASYIIATGGPDCVIRIWSAFVPGKASGVLCGHHSAICALVFLQSAQHLLSVSKDKCIKVWNVGEQSCIQTYTQLTSEIGEHTKLSVYFHHLAKKLIVGSAKLAIVHYGRTDDEKKTDGITHSQSVTKALYNSLFKCLITVGNDSAIMVWDIWTGQCTSIITDAHTRIEHGLTVTVEITAAAFEPISQQLLVTGARDGSLKVWNFNAGLCIRHMNIESNCEVTSVLWLQNRILAVGWNRHVTEFADLDSTELILDGYRRGSLGSKWPTIPRCTTKFASSSAFLGDFKGKAWEMRHTEDVIFAAAHPPQILATASYNGELILWRLETAQPYRRFHVANPTGRFAIDFKKRHQSGSEDESIASLSLHMSQSGVSAGSNESRNRRGHRVNTMKPRNMTKSGNLSKKSSKILQSNYNIPDLSSVSSSIKQLRKYQKAMTLRKRRFLAVSLPPEQASLRPLAVHYLLFLHARECLPKVGTLLVALEDGKIQVWSHKLQGRKQIKNENKLTESKKKEAGTECQDVEFLGSFTAIHSADDYVVSMATDENNEFLFTGDTAGYLKVWLLKNFYVVPPTPKIFMPLYRIRFPFLLKDRFQGRAKRSVQEQPLPLLLSSHRAHLRAITFLEYISEAKVVISCSSDCSVRIWTLGGRYIGTLGQNHPWPLLEHGKVIENTTFRIPPDISRVGSFTTMKVLTGADQEKKGIRSRNSLVKNVLTHKNLETKVHGQRVNEHHPLGKYFSLPKRSGNIHLHPKLDQSFGNFVPVYSHIICPQLEPLDQPRPLNIATINQ